MKHDAHIRTAWIHFFPFKLFILSISVFFMIGLFLGQIWGFHSAGFFNL